MSADERLHATDQAGHYVKTEARKPLLAEIKAHAQKNGDAHLAVPVVHLILLNSDGLIRLVKRGDKPENPYLWDKSVGGHVVCDNPNLPIKSFTESLIREMAEEVGIQSVEVASDRLIFERYKRSEQIDFNQTALVHLLDYDPWMGSVCRNKEGLSWVRRGNTAIYVGLFDGPFEFMDGEAIDHRLVSRDQLCQEVHDTPWLFADSMRILLRRYYHFLK